MTDAVENSAFEWVFQQHRPIAAMVDVIHFEWRRRLSCAQLIFSTRRPRKSPMLRTVLAAITLTIALITSSSASACSSAAPDLPPRFVPLASLDHVRCLASGDRPVAHQERRADRRGLADAPQYRWKACRAVWEGNGSWIGHHLLVARAPIIGRKALARTSQTVAVERQLCWRSGALR